MDEVKEVIELLTNTFASSSINPVKDEWIETVEKRYPNIPESLKYLYQNLGYGTLNSYYSIHVLLEPDDIYDQETADNLKGKYIVGDDFCGICHAYDADNNWTFGFINCNGEFNRLDSIYPDFIAFLKELAFTQKSNK